MLTISYEGCERLTALVNDILDVQKMATGNIEYIMENTKICALVEKVIEQCQSYAVKFNVKYKLEKDINNVYCYIDEGRFNQALTNLLSNAAKFSPAKSVVIIRISKEKGNRVKVSVEDKGVGIPKEFKKRIFQKFAQVNSSSSRNREGSGLGLNITKSIIEALNGEVGYNSVEGQGTTFYFILPIAD